MGCPLNQWFSTRDMRPLEGLQAGIRGSTTHEPHQSCQSPRQKAKAPSHEIAAEPESHQWDLKWKREQLSFVMPPLHGAFESCPTYYLLKVALDFICRKTVVAQLGHGAFIAWWEVKGSSERKRLRTPALNLSSTPNLQLIFHSYLLTMLEYFLCYFQDYNQRKKKIQDINMTA